jgi:hypothetical protein
MRALACVSEVQEVILSCCSQVSGRATLSSKENHELYRVCTYRLMPIDDLGTVLYCHHRYYLGHLLPCDAMRQ